MTSNPEVLIVGGYGTFGGRLARLLKDENLSIIIAGRCLAAARKFCEEHRGTARLTPAHFDRDQDPGLQLVRLSPQLVVDASGPFQTYGEEPYRLVEACIEQSIHYVDLADGAAFVEGVASFDTHAKAKDVFALCGVSSCPALTAAVTRRLMDGLVHLQSITAGIAPSPRAGVGFNVVKAIAAYAGEPIRLRRGGVDAKSHALTEQKHVTIAPPGCMPLHSRLFSLVEVPDLKLLPRAWPELTEVWVGAAPVPAIFHRMLIALAWLRRFRLMPPIAFLAKAMHWVTLHCRWGEHRGGMFVRITGRDAESKAIAREWHLIAENDLGPFVPSMGAASVICKWRRGESIAPGARAGIDDVELEDYERWFENLGITTGVRTGGTRDSAVFKRVLDGMFDELPTEIRAIHDGASLRTLRGVASVERGNGWLADLVARLIGFPDAAPEIPVEVRIECRPARERWTRRFGVRTFFSEMTAGVGKEAGLLIERFGPISIALALVWEPPHLRFIVRRARIGPIPLPLWLAPTSTTHEAVEQGRFCFDVSIAHPLVGLLVRYRGWLVPDASSASQR